MNVTPVGLSSTSDPGDAPSGPSIAKARSTRLKGLWASSVGNAMEWFDWTCYAIFSSFLAQTMFDRSQGLSALLATLAIFAVGFVARPIGGVFFGRIADVKGRRFAMIATTSLMAIGSLVIGLAPTYEQVGVISSAILVVARIGQGLAHGGESAASYVYISEIAPDHSRGFWSSAVYVAVSIGTLSATALGTLLTSTLTAEQMLDWGWRVPFLVGSLLGLYACFMRRGMVESEIFEEEQGSDTGAQTENSTSNFCKGLRLVILTGGSTITYYTWCVFASTYAITVKGISASDAYVASLCAQLVGLVALPVFGALSDRVGRRPMCLAFASGMFLLAFPLNWLVSSSAWTLFWAQSVALIFWAMLTSIYPALMAEQLPTRSRAMGIGLISSLSVALFGGTAPYLNTLLTNMDMQYLFTLYLMVLCLGSFIAAWQMPETRNISLAKV